VRKREATHLKSAPNPAGTSLPRPVRYAELYPPLRLHGAVRRPSEFVSQEPHQSTESSPAVFVVDDDASVRKALARLLRARGMRVETFASGEDFLEVAPVADQACLLLDLDMPGANGLALQQSLVSAGIMYPIVFVTGTGDVPASVKAMKAGAIDFIQKPFDETDLLHAVGEAQAVHVDLRKRQVEAEEVGRRLARLTPREAEVMELVATGLRNRAVADRLGISERTVKVHRGRAMKKLCADSVPDLARMLEVRTDWPMKPGSSAPPRSA